MGSSKKKAIVELSADDKKFTRGLSAAEKRWKSFHGSVSKGGKNLGGALMGGTGLGVLGGGAAIGAGLVAAGKDALDFDAALTDLAISSSGAVGKMDDVRQRILDVSTATRASKEDLTSAASTFVALTGDGKAAAASLETFGRVQQATGASMEDVARTAAAMKEQLKIDPSDFENAFSIVVAAGKAGAVEMKDMAGLLTELSAAGKKFKGIEGKEGLATMSAAMQAVMKDAGTAGEAATMLDAFMGSIVGQSDKLAKHGVQVFDKDAATGVETLKSLPDILDQMAASDLVKSPRLLKEVFTLKEARKGAEALLTQRKLFDDIRRSAMGATDIADDLATRHASASSRVSGAWNGVKNAVSEAFDSEVLANFATGLEFVITKVGELLSEWKTMVEGIAEGVASVVTEVDDAMNKSLITPDQILDEADKKGTLGDLAKRDDELGRRARAKMERLATRRAALATSHAPGNFAESASDMGLPGGSAARGVWGADTPGAGHGVYDVNVKVGIKRGNLTEEIENDPRQSVQVP